MNEHFTKVYRKNNNYYLKGMYILIEKFYNFKINYF